MDHFVNAVGYDDSSDARETTTESVAIPLEQDEEREHYPFLSSRLLCPSNLGALLESTTVSLVSGGRKEPPDSEKGTEAVENEDTFFQERRSIIKQQATEEEPQLAQSCSGKHQDEITDIQPESKKEISSDIPLLITPAILPPSPLSTTKSMIDDSHSSCYSSEAQHQRHQLCIAIDEDNPVTYGPTLHHSYGSPKSCGYVFTANDVDVPGIVRYEYRTHSRNVSETPSLPPLYGSSTSSAYHSRNSSLGSQFSNCFESDSLLNQHTDLDSSPTDLYVIKKHDSKFSRQGDSSPSSYSSDLSLHHHMNQPLDPKDAIVCLSSNLNLEDTLCNLSSERIEECKKHISMKSSEWIKHQLESHRDSLVLVKVSSKTKHVVHFNVKAGDVIIWEFATKKRDISFGVSFEATEVATKNSLPDSHESLNHKMSSILPIFRVNTHAHPTIGTHTAAMDGIYEIIFDNTYSRYSNVAGHKGGALYVARSSITLNGSSIFIENKAAAFDGGAIYLDNSTLWPHFIPTFHK